MKMTDEVFEVCLEHWKASVGNQSFWGELARRFGYSSVESIRSAFKRKRQELGIEKEYSRTLQQQPVVAVMDFETLPLKIEGYLFGIRDQYIDYGMVAKDSHLLSWAGKYLGGSRIYSDVMHPFEAIDYNSRRITESAMHFINTADIVIGHNWDSFDGKVFNSELMFHSLPPVKYRSIDTLSLLRANMHEASYKLKDINKKYGIRDKVSNEGMALWRRCARGSEEALMDMLRYNQGDILATEALFWKIQPYCGGMANFSTYATEGKQICNCGGTLLRDTANPYWYTNTARYNRLRCSDCGAVHRGKKNDLKKEQRSQLTVSL